MKTEAERIQLGEAIMKILANTTGFTDCRNEDGLFRALLHRAWAKFDGDDSEFDYWGRSANAYAKVMLEAGELPE